VSAPARARRPMDARIRERRRQVALERARRRRRRAASVAVAVTLAANGLGLTYTPLFAVADVAVVGVEGERRAAVRQAAAVAEGERLLGVDLERVASDVEALPWVRTAAVRRAPPSAVEISVRAREPVAVVHVGAAAWLVDVEGVVVAGGADDELVRIDAPQAAVPGSGAPVEDAAVGTALAVHRELPEHLRSAVVRYDAGSEREVRALLDGTVVGQAPEDGVWVRFGTAERVPAKAQVTELLLGQIRDQADRLGGAAVAELDVRAPDNPVVVPRS
jgi:cell division protein FtsQ